MRSKLDIDWKQIDEIISRYENDKEALLMIMQDISDIYNYVPPEIIPVLAEKLGVRKSHIFSVATFYKTISLVPRGKFIVHVCTGGVRCIGCCASGPVMTVNKETHGGLDRSSALKVIENYRNISS